MTQKKIELRHKRSISKNTKKISIENLATADNLELYQSFNSYQD